MNSSFTNAEQPEICSNFNPNIKHNMETPNHITDIIFEKEIYSINWSDIENTEIDYDNYLDEIENFFREDFENDILEDDII